MERELRGTPGEVRYEVDARNVPVRRLEGGSEPVPGNDVYLSVDIDLQYHAEKSLAAQMKAVSERRPECDRSGCDPPGGFEGSVVVQNPTDGSILAMASYPTFNPSAFTGGISSTSYADLTSEGKHEPLFNKAIAGAYAPGSTWKLFSAYAGLARGQITPATPVNDPGYYKVQGCSVSSTEDCERDGFRRNPNGTVNLAESLTVSSDVYYFQLGDQMWQRRDQLR